MRNISIKNEARSGYGSGPVDLGIDSEARNKPRNHDFLTLTMMELNSRRFAAVAVTTLVLISSFLFADKGYSQLPPCNPLLTCDNCLVVGIDTNHHLCDCPEGCFTWDIRNCCPSSVCSITMHTKDGKPFTTCCVVVYHPSYHQWHVTQNTPSSVTYSANTSADCLATGDFIQITTCGLDACDMLVFDWDTANNECGVNGTQGLHLRVPPCH